MRFLSEHLPLFDRVRQLVNVRIKVADGVLLLKFRRWKNVSSLTVIHRRDGTSSADAFTLWGKSRKEIVERLTGWLAKPVRASVDFSHPEKACFRTILEVGAGRRLSVRTGTPWNSLWTARGAAFVEALERALGHVATARPGR